MNSHHISGRNVFDNLQREYHPGYPRTIARVGEIWNHIKSEGAMIDSAKERLISLPEAKERIPPARGGKRTHASTLLRWITQGAKGPSGQLVRLEAVRFGSRWFTSAEAIQRFTARLTPVFDDAPGFDRIGA